MQKTTIIWGGATKGVIFAILLERAGAKIDRIIDVNQAKQGKYASGTGIQINSPCQAIDTLPIGSDIFVMNGNYLSEINDIVKGRFNLIAID